MSISVSLGPAATGVTAPNSGIPVAGKDGSGNLELISVDASGGINVNAAIANGADVAEGATTDVAVVGDNSGTVSAKLRGINKILNDVWDSVNHWFKVSIQNSSLAVTQSTTPWSVAQDTASIANGSAVLTPLFAKITASSSGATALVGAVTAKKIRVVGYVLIANGTVNVKFQSHTTPTDETGLLYLAANTGAAPAYMPVGHFETIAGEGLDINLSANVAVGGHLTYITV